MCAKKVSSSSSSSSSSAAARDNVPSFDLDSMAQTIAGVACAIRAVTRTSEDVIRECGSLVNLVNALQMAVDTYKADAKVIHEQFRRQVRRSTLPWLKGKTLSFDSKTGTFSAGIKRKSPTTTPKLESAVTAHKASSADAPTITKAKNDAAAYKAECEQLRAKQNTIADPFRKAAAAAEKAAAAAKAEAAAAKEELRQASARWAAERVELLSSLNTWQARAMLAESRLSEAQKAELEAAAA